MKKKLLISNSLKVKKISSIYLVPLIILFSFGCSTTKPNLPSGHKLNPGMTKTEVESIMGVPIKSDFNKNVEEWFYCSTGSSTDQHLALFFHDNLLVAKTNYNVSLMDTRGITGSCENFIKQGDYRVPDKVIEIRMRY